MRVCDCSVSELDHDGHLKSTNVRAIVGNGKSGMCFSISCTFCTQFLLILYSEVTVYFHNGTAEPPLEQRMLVFNFTSKCSP